MVTVVSPRPRSSAAAPASTRPGATHPAWSQAFVPALSGSSELDCFPGLAPARAPLPGLSQSSLKGSRWRKDAGQKASPAQGSANRQTVLPAVGRLTDTGGPADKRTPDLHPTACPARPYLLGGGSGGDVGAGARGAAKRGSAEARRGQSGLGGVGGVGGAGLAKHRARGPEGLLALRQALILQHLLWAQHTRVICPCPHAPETRQPWSQAAGGGGGCFGHCWEAALTHVDPAPSRAGGGRIARSGPSPPPSGSGPGRVCVRFQVLLPWVWGCVTSRSGGRTALSALPQLHPQCLLLLGSSGPWRLKPGSFSSVPNNWGPGSLLAQGSQDTFWVGRRGESAQEGRAWAPRAPQWQRGPSAERPLRLLVTHLPKPTPSDSSQVEAS